MLANSQFKNIVGARIGWLHPIIVVGYLVLVSWTREVGGNGPPFPHAMSALAAVIVGGAVLRRTLVTPLLISVAFVVAASVLTDIAYIRNIHFTDLGIYLTAGRHLLDGQPIYQIVPLTAMPRDYTTLPFLYPPPTIPLFALLAALPGDLGGILFVAGSVGVLLIGLRRLGLSWAWSLAFLAWPPVLNGIWSGNVSVLIAGLFLLGPSVGAGLILAPLLKPYNIIGGLWLVRERRVRPLIAGLAIALALCVVTLPIVGGVQAWRDWIDGLITFTESERHVRQLYGLSLQRYFVPAFAVLAAVTIVTLIALRARGTSGLSRLGVATMVGQPTLYLHGFIVGLPGLLGLRSGWFWLAMAAVSVSGPRIVLPRAVEWPGPWAVVAIIFASWAVPMMCRDSTSERDEDRDARAGISFDETLHPLGPIDRPWPLDQPAS